MTFPRLTACVALAISGDLHGLLKALALRSDYRDARLHKKAAMAVQSLGDKKMSLGEAELIGHTQSGEIPETPEWLAQALIDLAKGNNGNNTRPE